MTNIVKKIFNVITSENSTQRIILFLNKTYLLRFLFKNYQILKNFKVFIQRKNLAQAKLTNEQQRRLDELHTKGYTDVTDLLDLKALTELDNYASEKLEHSDDFDINTQNYSKKIWMRLSDDGQVLDSTHPLIQISTQTQILQILQKYFRSAPFLDYVLLTLSKNSNPETALTQSQLWHYDRDDYRVVKMFVYLTDVLDDKSGPFTLLSKETSQKLPLQLVNKTWSDEQIDQLVAQSEVIQMKAPKLRSFLVCTDQCLHMGSRIKEDGHRLMTTSTFITIPSAHPWAGSRTYPIKGQISEIQRLALQKN